MLRAANNTYQISIFESILDMNARVGIYSLHGSFGGEWVQASNLLLAANILHPFALNEVKNKYENIIWQGVSDYSRILERSGISPNDVERCISEHLILVINFPALHESWRSIVESSSYVVG